MDARSRFALALATSLLAGCAPTKLDCAQALNACRSLTKKASELREKYPEGTVGYQDYRSAIEKLERDAATEARKANQMGCFSRDDVDPSAVELARAVLAPKPVYNNEALVRNWLSVRLELGSIKAEVLRLWGTPTTRSDGLNTPGVTSSWTYEIRNPDKELLATIHLLFNGGLNGHDNDEGPKGGLLVEWSREIPYGSPGYAYNGIVEVHTSLPQPFEVHEKGANVEFEHLKRNPGTLLEFK
ncbi:MAG TPA: hypothetical protein VHE55_05285 [Fimbriimonadaceae bacterium]|nr:hypothetical protein [Fimbriimonadaceae bacterium]